MIVGYNIAYKKNNTMHFYKFIQIENTKAIFHVQFSSRKELSNQIKSPVAILKLLPIYSWIDLCL